MTDDTPRSTDVSPTRRDVLADVPAALLGVGATSLAGSATAATAAGQSSDDDLSVDIEVSPSGPFDVGDGFLVSPDLHTEDAEVNVYRWGFDDGTTQDSLHAVHAYEYPGTYDVTLEIVSEDGRFGHDTTEVTVAGSVSHPTIRLSATLSDLSRDGYFRSEITLQNPGVLDHPDVESLTLVPDSRHENVDPDGFVESGDEPTTYEPDANAESPTLTTGVEGIEFYTEDDEFSVFSHTPVDPTVRVESAEGVDPEVVWSYEVDGEGFVSDPTGIIYFDEYQSATTETEYGPLSVYVPEVTDVEVDVETIVQALAAFSESHAPSTPRAKNIGVAFPSGTTIRRGSAFQQEGNVKSARFYVEDAVTFNQIGSTWFHEYAHTLADFKLDNSSDGAHTLAWLGEAHADYYAALGPLELEHRHDESDVYDGTTFRAFREQMDRGTSWDSDLRERENYDGNVLNYEYGALVLGAIDRAIRDRTSDSTLEDVLEKVRDDDERTSNDQFLQFVEEVADVPGSDGAELKTDAADWIASVEHPEPWSAAEHEAAFGYAVPDPVLEDTELTAVVDGERQTIDGDRIEPDQPVRFEATIQNRGSADVELEVGLSEGTIDDVADALETKTAVIDGNDTEVVEFEHQIGEETKASFEVVVDTSGFFDNTSVNFEASGGINGEQDLIALEPNARLLTEDEATTLNDPAQVDADATLALETSAPTQSAFTLEQVDGYGVVDVDNDSSFGSVPAADLETGATYAVELPPNGSTTQYVEVVEAGDPDGPTVEMSGPPTDPLSTGESFLVLTDVEPGDAEIESYHWTLGDGTTASGHFIYEWYSESGTYDLEVSVTDQNGLTDTDSVEVTVVE